MNPPVLDVVIVGAGIAGIGMAARLKRTGREEFAVLERAEDLGGTWRDNVYPGVACDIPSHLYEYSFRPNPRWSRRFAPGAELHAYLRDTAREEGVTERIRFCCAVENATWQDHDSCWLLQTSQGTLRARVLVMAAGRLSEPRMPRVPGLDRFAGPVSHSARWDMPSLDGMRVGVVGTGASAVQLLPHVTEEGREVVLFQRTPAWVLPRGDHAYDHDSARPARAALADEADRLFAARISGSTESQGLQERARAHLQRSIADPVLRAQLAPRYEVGCKRAVFSDDYYPSLAGGHVALEPSALRAIEDGQVAVAASGSRHRLDALVLATGFETTRPPFASLVCARGRTLADHWCAGMTSHASTAVTGFPNLFILDGPNSALGHHSAFEVIEAQVDHVLGALAHLDGAAGPLEVSPGAESRYTALIDELAARTVWTGGCGNRYLDPVSRRLTVLWPGSAADFRRLNARFDPADYLPVPVG